MAEKLKESTKVENKKVVKKQPKKTEISSPKKDDVVKPLTIKEDNKIEFISAMIFANNIGKEFEGKYGKCVMVKIDNNLSTTIKSSRIKPFAIDFSHPKKNFRVAKENDKQSFFSISAIKGLPLKASEKLISVDENTGEKSVEYKTVIIPAEKVIEIFEGLTQASTTWVQATKERNLHKISEPENDLNKDSEINELLLEEPEMV